MHARGRNETDDRDRPGRVRFDSRRPARGLQGRPVAGTADDRGTSFAGPMLVAIGVLLAGAGLALITSSGWITGDAVPVEATVVHSEVVPDGSRATAVVAYNYTYEGRQYTGDGVFAGNDRPVDADRAAELVAQYPAGATVTAYVDADSPDEAHLIPERASPLYYLFVGAGALSVSLGLVATADQFLGLR